MLLVGFVYQLGYTSFFDERSQSGDGQLIIAFVTAYGSKYSFTRVKTSGKDGVYLFVSRIFDETVVRTKQRNIPG